MRSIEAFAFLTAATALLMLMLIAYQSKLIIERLDSIESQSRACDAPVDESATPQRAPWPEIL